VRAEEDLSAGELLELAGMVDTALRQYDRTVALAGAERLLDAVFSHHRTLRPVRASCDRFTADLIETETVSMIALVALTIGQLMEGGRWPDPMLRRNVGELVDIESDHGVLPVPAGSVLRAR
jgi:hypothetical protein